jgi:hypothetical protein
MLGGALLGAVVAVVVRQRDEADEAEARPLHARK